MNKSRIGIEIENLRLVRLNPSLFPEVPPDYSCCYFEGIPFILSLFDFHVKYFEDKDGGLVHLMIVLDENTMKKINSVYPEIKQIAFDGVFITEKDKIVYI